MGNGPALLKPRVAVDDLLDGGQPEALDGIEGAVVEIVRGEQRAGVGSLRLTEEELVGVEPTIEGGQRGAVSRGPHPQRAPRVHEQTKPCGRTFRIPESV